MECNQTETGESVKFGILKDFFVVLQRFLKFVEQLTHTRIPLAGINTAFAVAGAQEIVRDRLVVGSVAVLIPPNRQLRFPLHGRLLAAVVCRSPANNARSSSCKRGQNDCINTVPMAMRIQPSSSR